MERKCEITVGNKGYNAYEQLYSACKIAYNDGKVRTSSAKKWLVEGNILLNVGGVIEDRRIQYDVNLNEEYSSQIYIYMTKSPFRFSEKFLEACKGTTILASDKKSTEYLKGMGKEVYFIPSPGLKAKSDVSWKNRKKEVFFPGGYLKYKTTKKHILKNVPDILQPTIWKIIKNLQKDISISLEDAIKNYLQEEKFLYDKDLIDEILRDYGFLIEEYIARWQRERVIKMLLAKQIPVSVMGANWEVFASELNPEQRKFLKVYVNSMDLRSTTNLMGKYKVVLNIAPNLKDGIHERVSCALESGAYCFTEKNPYVEHLQTEYEGLKLYDGNKLGQLVKEIKKTLEENEQPQHVGESRTLSVETFAEKLHEVVKRNSDIKNF